MPFQNFILISLVIGLLSPTVLAAPPVNDKPDKTRASIELLAQALSLPSAVEVAVADNPGLAAMRARAEAMSAIPSQLGTLPDPTLSFNALNLPVDSFSVGQEGMTQMQIGFGQKFPFPGKLGLREDAQCT